MENKLVFAIKDFDSDLFLTRNKIYTSCLKELSAETRFFNTRAEAMKFIEDRFRDGGNTLLQNQLAWWLLEKIYGKDRWHIECSLKEYQDACDQFKNLKVVPIILGYKDDVVKP